MMPNGYGQFSVGYGKTAEKMGAHRASYIIHVGEIPSGLVVCHKCDVKCCVNPQHLFVGTSSDNMQDASKKGRMKGAQNAPRGERNKKSKLTAAAVAEIRSSTRRMCDLAEKFGVSKMTIWMARSRRSWKEAA